MRIRFLTADWYTKVAELTAEAGDLNVPAEITTLILNLTVATGDGEKQLHTKAGQFVEGHVPDAPATIFVDEGLAKELFVEGNMQAGMQAFMSGQMRVEGDMAQLMALQAVQPSEQMQDLADDIREMTD